MRHLAALLLRRGDGLLVVLDGLGVDQGAHQGVLVEGVADGDAAVGLDQFVDHVVGDGRVEEEPAEGGAALTGGPDGGEHGGSRCKIEIGIVHDDHGVVAAEFEQ